MNPYQRNGECKEHSAFVWFLIGCVAIMGMAFTIGVIEALYTAAIDRTYESTQPLVCRDEFGHRSNCNDTLDYTLSLPSD